MTFKPLDPVTKYANDVVKGKILAGNDIILASQRHLDDLERQDTNAFNFHFDVELLHKFLAFAALVPDPDDGVPKPLMPWQIFILGSIIAWRNNKTGGKRFRRAIISIARAQGKTYLASIIAAYDFFVQSYQKSNQDILLSANTTDQTKKLFNYTKATVELMLNSTFKGTHKKDVAVRFMDIFDNRRKNQIVRISAEGGKYDGYHATTAIFDEAGDQKTREAFKKITSGQTNNKEAIFIQISTAYQNPNAPLREDIKIIRDAIRSGERVLDDNFLAVWSQDEASEIERPETWIKSNPLLGLDEKKDAILNGLVSDRDVAVFDGTTNDFLVKSLNVWVNADENSAFELQDVTDTVIDTGEFDIRGRDVYIGFDNSMTSDDAAVAFVFPYRDDDGNKKWHLMQHSFIPWHKAGSIGAKEKQDGINYTHMQELGYADITQHEKGLIDNEFVFTWLTDFVSDNELNVIYYAYDAAHTYAIIKAIEEATTWTMLPVRQGIWTLNEPTKWLTDAFVEHRVTHYNDLMMEKSLMNAVIVSADNGIKIDKNKATYKIDLVDALINALVEAINHFEDFTDLERDDDYDRMNDEQLNNYILSGRFGF